MRVPPPLPEPAAAAAGSIVKQPPRPVPWRFLFSSTEVWAIIIANFTHNWSGCTLLRVLAASGVVGSHPGQIVLAPHLRLQTHFCT